MRAEHTNPKTAGMERNRHLRQELDRRLRHLNKLGALRDGGQAHWLYADHAPAGIEEEPTATG